MSFPPVFPVPPTLPADWQERVQHLAGGDHGPLTLFVEHVASIVSLHRERSIGVPEVQELALSACGFPPADPFSILRSRLTRLEQAAGGSWPVEEPLKEYSRGMEKKQVHEIARGLDSMQAEWFVLDGFVRDGWRPILMKRGNGKPDWRVRKQRELNIDAKYKAVPGSSHARLAWMLRGAALLPAYELLRDFSWSWAVREECRDSSVARFSNRFHAALPRLRELLTKRAVLDEPEEIVPPLKTGSRLVAATGGHILVDTFEDDDGFKVELTLGPEPPSPSCGRSSRTRKTDVAIYLYGTAAPFFHPCGSISYAERRLSDDDREKLGEVLHRLKMKPCLNVVVWEVPFAWEHIAEHLQDWWNTLSADHNWPPAVLWPIGNFKAAGNRWFANSLAVELLGGAAQAE
jgi:hypothetical protein